MIKNKGKVEEELKKFIDGEKEKINESVQGYVASDNSKGISQMIGRRFGYIWEQITIIVLKNDEDLILKGRIYYNDFVKFWIERNSIDFERECCKENSKKLLIKFLNENTGTATQDLCDYSFVYNSKLYAVDTKYKFNSNDSNTVREIANSAIHLTEMGYVPILLLRTNRAESQLSPIKRFEKSGWNIIDGKNATDLIKNITGFDLEKWIENNLKIWDYLEPYHSMLEKLRFGEENWIY